MVRTVLGDVEPSTLGAIDYHEHLFHRSPILPGEDLDDPAASEAEFAAFLRSGFDGIVDATPIGLGRRPGALATIAARTRGAIVAATGRHRDAHYAGGGRLDALDLAAVFERELTVGIAASDDEYGVTDAPAPALIDGRPVRAGLIKTGIDYWRISTTERAALEAAAAAHLVTGAPVMVHTERASAVPELLGLLEASGVAATRVAIAHADRNPDAGLHAEIAAAGAYLGYDGAARYRDHPESVLLDCLAAVVEAGHGDRVLLGGDVARRSSFAAYGGMPGLAYLGDRHLRRVRARLGDALTTTILVDNPAAYLAWSRA
ncbi:aryldialkylphosphatase [Agromyces protaetiae]|uniref:Aryldialkylphosphatase n=1 Tax=Agromyces protaetiae TaxID=2509455 RepID=A0A4P6FF64_9MICO|nr:aryldialkylphosphatase [Agromyces protaetiae]